MIGKLRTGSAKAPVLFPLYRENVIGSGKRADCRIRSEGIARSHARLVYDGKTGWRLIRMCGPGYLIRCGKTSLLLEEK